MSQDFTLLNLIAPLFAILMIMKGFSHFRRGEKTWREMITIACVWGLFGYIGAWPGSVDRLSGFLGIKSGINVLIFSSIVILFYIVFQLMIAYEQVEMRLTRVVRAIALKDAQCQLEKKE